MKVEKGSANKGYWQRKENQKKFFDSFAVKYGIKYPQDWGMIWRKQIIREGGYQVLSVNGNSVYTALKNVYPGMQLL